MLMSWDCEGRCPRICCSACLVRLYGAWASSQEPLHGCRWCEMICSDLLSLHAGFLRQLRDVEAKMDIHPDPDVDAYLKASAVEGARRSPITQYMIRILGLEVPRNPVPACHLQSNLSVC